MEVKIGVQHVARELVLESDQTSDEVQQLLTKALADGAPLSLRDEKGRVVIVPIDRLAYLDIGEATVRRVGFGAG